MTLPELFDAQARRTPDAPAVWHDGTMMTYRELHTRADRLARALVARGAQPGRVVAIALPRTPDLIVAVWAVLKSGAAYLTLDPAWPSARNEFYVSDAQPVLTLRATDLTTSDPVELRPPRPLDPAYIVYTSGSTGTPKGVMIQHQGLLTLGRWAIETLGAAAFERVLGTTSLSFDLSLFEVVFPMLAGGSVDLFESLLSLGDGPPWTGSTVTAVPTVYAQLRQAECADTFLFIGEALSAQLVRNIKRHRPNARVFNLYGPAEGTSNATAWLCDPDAEGPPPIGRAVAGMRTYVLDAALRPAPPGVTAELYIAGPCLAAGYLNRPGMTSQRFVADPFGPPGDRMYRTGDLAFSSAEGVLHFVGRVDHQVKIRGHRVEPGEIESVLARMPGVGSATVIAHKDDRYGSRLVGYLTGEHCDIPGIRARLRAEVPEFMVPAELIAITELPRLPNGKVDRKALARLSTERTPPARAEASPDGAQQLLCQVFREVLGLPVVGTSDSFFDLGGDSIVAIHLVSRARRAGVVFSLEDVFERATVAGLAAVARVIRAADLADPSDSGIGEVPATPRVRTLEQLPGPIDSLCQSQLVPVGHPLTEDDLVDAVQQVLDLHHVLRMGIAPQPAGWRVRIGPPGSVSARRCVRRVEATGLHGDELTAVVQREAFAAQARLSPTHGAVLQVVWFDSGDASRLLVMVHHLAIDSTSWHTLLGDLRLACSGHDLAPASTSFRRWAEHMVTQAHSAERLAELGLWRDMLAPSEPVLGRRPLDQSRDLVATSASLQVIWSDEWVGRLVAMDPAEINAVLLAALAMAVREFTGQTSVLVSTERHGRDALPDTIDLSRTIGWFASEFPIRLDAPPRNVLRRVQEQLAAIPDAGVGYGQLRYLNAETGPLLAGAGRPQISLVYIGRVSDGDWLMGGDGVGLGADPAMALNHTLSIGALLSVTGGPKLRAKWTWASGILTRDQAKRLTGLWQAALREITAESRELPRDRFMADLPAADVGQLEARYPAMSDILPMTALQEGFLFHAMYDRRAPDWYTVQLAFDLAGPLDTGALRSGARAVLDRHPSLRCAFVHTRSGHPVQVVVDDLDPGWSEVDLTGVPDRDEVADRLAAGELARRFDLADPPLVRLMVLRLDTGRFRLLITNHHILLDGWSTSLLLRDLFTLYQGGDLPEIASYPDYLAWLGKQDTEAAVSAWREALAGLAGPTLLTTAEQRRGEAQHVETERTLTDELATAAAELARRCGVTVNTVFQCCWGILLARLTGRRDVVFGTVVSVRPPEIPGVEEILGLLINTLPVRVRIDPAESLRELFRRIRREQTSLLSCQHVGLTEIRSGELFDTTMMFDNFPVSREAVRAASTGLTVTGFHGTSVTHYPLNFAVSPSEAGFTLRMGYRPDVFDAPSIDRMLTDLVDLLTVAVTAPSTTVADVLSHSQQQRPAVPVRKTAEAREPRTARERTLCALFAETLGLAEVGIDDNFFDTGGHSLLAARLVSRIRADLGFELDVADLYTAPTVALLADRTGDALAGALDVLLPLRETGSRVPLFCVHAAGGIGWPYTALMRELGPDQPLYALQARGLETTGKLAANVAEVARDCVDQIRAVCPNGPYRLLGWSFGGLVAHAIGTLLQAEGARVDLLALLDAYPSGGESPDESLDESTGGAAELAALRDLIGPADLSENQFTRVVEVFRNNRMIAKTFQPDVFRGDVMFFEAKPDPADPLSTVDSWLPYVGRLDVHRCSHPHATLGMPGGLAEVGPLLATRLERLG